MSDFVFKIKRAEITFEAELSSGEKTTLTLLETNTRQLQELINTKDTQANIEISLKQLQENLRGEKKEEFIQDLLENGSLDSFYTIMSERFKRIKDSKKKN